MMAITTYFAEIIESSLTTWKAQSWNWDHFPVFGSLLVIESGATNNSPTIFGLVHTIETGSSDPSRSVFAYQKTELELMQEQPQIFQFLRTTFSCLTIGYQQQYAEENRIIYQLAPEPPKIHAFVRPASQQEIAAFFSCSYYLHGLFCQQQQIALDELLLAVLNYLSNAHALNKQLLLDFIETFSVLTANDYRRLKLFLQRAQAILKIDKYGTLVTI